MLAEQRRAQILQVVQSQQFASLPELAEALAVSESTVRRDLEQLEQQGVVRRTHGGVFYTGTAPQLPHFDSRQPGQMPQKQAIARVAAEMIEDGDAVLLDGGTTTYEIAHLLIGRPVHVVTNSLPIANLLAADSRSDLVLIGGNICPRTGVAQGPYANKMLGMVRIRRAMISVAGVNEAGLFNNNLLLVETERAMIDAADEVVVVADSTKFGHHSLGHVCSLDEIDRVIVDDGIAPAWQEKLADAGVEVLIAHPTETRVTQESGI